jgi:hypothetical protein
MFELAVGHTGRGSEYYAHRRKNDKANVNLVELKAPKSNDDKLHLVSEYDLLSLVGDVHACNQDNPKEN